MSIEANTLKKNYQGDAKLFISSIFENIMNRFNLGNFNEEKVEDNQLVLKNSKKEVTEENNMPVEKEELNNCREVSQKFVDSLFNHCEPYFQIDDLVVLNKNKISLLKPNEIYLPKEIKLDRYASIEEEVVAQKEDDNNLIKNEMSQELHNNIEDKNNLSYVSNKNEVNLVNNYEFKNESEIENNLAKNTKESSIHVLKKLDEEKEIMIDNNINLNDNNNYKQEISLIEDNKKSFEEEHKKSIELVQYKEKEEIINQSINKINNLNERLITNEKEEINQKFINNIEDIILQRVVKHKETPTIAPSDKNENIQNSSNNNEKLEKILPTHITTDKNEQILNSINLEEKNDSLNITSDKNEIKINSSKLKEEKGNEEDEELRSYINSIQVKHDSENSLNKKSKRKEKPKPKDPKDMSKNEYDDYLKKIEDSINDNTNNNYDFDVDDIFYNKKENATLNSKTKEENHNNNINNNINNNVSNNINNNVSNNVSNNLSNNLSNNVNKKKLDIIVKNETPKEKIEIPSIKKIELRKQQISSNKVLPNKKITITETSEDKMINKMMEETNAKFAEKTPTKSTLNMKKNFLCLYGNKSPSKEKITFNSPIKINDNTSAYLYKKENKISKIKNVKDKNIFSKSGMNFKKMAQSEIDDFNKKKNDGIRNYTARSRFNAYSNSKYKFSALNIDKREFSSKQIHKKCEEQKKNSLQLMKDPRNPYSTHWFSKILEKQFKVQFAVSGFCNGVPLIKLTRKKDDQIPLISHKLNEIMHEANMVHHQEDLFNRNMKNFYKLRKDIQEESSENEMRESFENTSSGDIEFPFILNYLKK